MLFKDKGKRKKFFIVMSIVIILTMLVSLCTIYLNDFYHADMKNIENFSKIHTAAEIQIIDNTIIVEPAGTTEGFIFYPGGKVEYTAYIPLMKVLAEKGIFTAVVEMPFNLAVLDINAADGIQEKYPQIEKWYIGGHSLGGSMAASYVSENKDVFDGLILLGSYSTTNLSDTGLKMLSIYGSEDMIINYENYEVNKENLSSNFLEVVIDGGCHSYFGMYGLQDGDGTPSITNEEQINQTANVIADFIKNK